MPWALTKESFILLFGRFAANVTLASAIVTQGYDLLGVGWDTPHEILRKGGGDHLPRE